MNVVDSSLEDIGWGMRFVYNLKMEYVEDVLKMLYEEGAGSDEIERARSLFNNNQYNSALTYTNRQTRRTIMIFTDVTAQNEFVNSLVHEMMHLSRHIANCGNSEELCNSIGNMSGYLFKSIYKS